MPAAEPPRPTRAWGLLRRHSVWLPSLPGLLLGLCLVALGVGMLIRDQCVFLSVNERVGAQVLVLEGWVPDHVVRAAMEEFNRGGYRRILVTGGGIDRGEPLSEFKTFGELGRATLIRLGFPADKVSAVEGPAVDRDRTYNSALQLRARLQRDGALPDRIQILSTGPHGRRTRLLFEAAFGHQTRVGILSVPDPRYPQRRWWINSVGFRDVVAESIAYFYARFVFHATPVGEFPAESGRSAVSVIPN